MSDRETPQAGAVAPSPAPAQPAPPTPVADSGRGLRRLILLNGLGLLVLILIALGIFYLWHQSYYFYSTDDAVVSGSISSVAAPAPGTIQSVYHGLGSNVHAGNTIATLRPASGSTIRAVAPINGTIIAEGTTPGEVLPAGQPIAQLVDLSRLYITAYVEETHVKDISTGQGVDVTVDAIKGTTLHGTVSRILPVAASALSPLPTEDRSTGNFTKVTERVPVQIALDGYQGKTLFPGTSASITIHIHS